MTTNAPSIGAFTENGSDNTELMMVSPGTALSCEYDVFISVLTLLLGD